MLLSWLKGPLKGYFSCGHDRQKGAPLTLRVSFLQGHSVLRPRGQAAQEHGEQLGHVLGRASAQGEVSFQSQQTHGLAGRFTLPDSQHKKQLSWTDSTSGESFLLLWSVPTSRCGLRWLRGRRAPAASSLSRPGRWYQSSLWPQWTCSSAAQDLHQRSSRHRVSYSFCLTNSPWRYLTTNQTKH